MIKTVRLALHSIAYEAKTLNLAKEGYTAYYVDGTDGLDIHDGGSWAQAFKTIQHAVDEAGSWCKIFIRAGTYAEKVTIDGKYGVHLIGEKRETTIIRHSLLDDALRINSNNCKISGLTIDATAHAYGTHIVGNYNIVDDCILDSFNNGVYVASGEYNVIKSCKLLALALAETSNKYLTVRDCYCDGLNYGCFLKGKYAKIHDNEFKNCSFYGIHVEGEYNTVFHNNLISNTNQIEDTGSNNEWIENYYDNHTTDTNNDGLTDTAYIEGGATDYQPVSRRNGWKQESLGNTLGKNVSTMEFWSDNDPTVTLSPGITNVILPSVTVANLPAGISIIDVTGMIDIRELYNNSANENAINGAALIKVKKSTGAWGTDDVSLINIPDNSFPMAPSSIHAARMYVGDNNASSEVDGNATYNLRFDGNCAVDHSFLYLRDVAVGLRVYFTS